MQVAVQNARHPLPEGQRRGMSAAPVIPVFPLFLWGTARVIDLVLDPWGAVVIGWLHAVFAIVLLVSIVRDWRRLRFERGVSEGAASGRGRG
jgi:hypothetical protein